MKFVVRRKTLVEALKFGAIARTTKPVSPIVKVKATKDYLYIGGLDPSSVILSGVFVLKDPDIYVAEEEGELFLDVSNLIKVLPKMESDDLVVETKNDRIYFKGQEEIYSEALTSEEIEFPIEFGLKDGEPTLDRDLGTLAKIRITSIKPSPVKTENVVFKVENNKVYITSSSELSEFSKIYGLKEPLDQNITAYFDYDYFKNVAELLNKADIIDLEFNENVLIAKATTDWGKYAYLLMAKEI